MRGGANKESRAQHLLSRTKKTDTGCLEFIGCIQANGYGRATVDRKPDYAHRHIFRLVNGDIPDGLDVCHTCDNRRCINPGHLFAGSRLDNMRDAVRKGRQARGERLSILHQGERSSLAKLCDEQVVAIRVLSAAGETATDLARRFQCSADNIRRIIRRETWRHVA